MISLERRDKINAQLFLGCDISGYRDAVQFTILFAALIFFMCLYGYFQEIVIYNWFDRKLSVFTAALHFFGCVVCAAFLHVVGAASLAEGVSSILRPPKAPLYSYMILCVLKSAGQLFSNISMQHINFPTKILLKASLPIVTMALGYLLQNKYYSINEVFSLFVLTMGLIVFFIGDNYEFPEGTAVGFFCMFLSLVLSALTPMWQEHLSGAYNASSSEMLLNTYMGSFAISLGLTYIFGEMDSGMDLLLTTWTPFYLLSLFGFCTFAFLGANSSIGITIRYGAVTNGVCNSCRKVLSVIISIMSFPDRNGVSLVQLMGIACFSGGLFLRVNAKRAGETSKQLNLEIPKSASMASIGSPI